MQKVSTLTPLADKQWLPQQLPHWRWTSASYSHNTILKFFWFRGFCFFASAISFWMVKLFTTTSMKCRNSLMYYQLVLWSMKKYNEGRLRGPPFMYLLYSFTFPHLYYTSSGRGNNSLDQILSSSVTVLHRLPAVDVVDSGAHGNIARVLPVHIEQEALPDPVRFSSSNFLGQRTLCRTWKLHTVLPDGPIGPEAQLVEMVKEHGQRAFPRSLRSHMCNHSSCWAGRTARNPISWACPSYTASSDPWLCSYHVLIHCQVLVRMVVCPAGCDDVIQERLQAEKDIMPRLATEPVC